jgi:hypothetical protein
VLRVVIVPPWWTNVPVTLSSLPVGLRVTIWNEPPLMYVGTEPSGSCSTLVFQTARSPAFPTPAPAKEPTVDVNAYSKPAIANEVDAGAADAPAGSVSGASETFHGTAPSGFWARRGPYCSGHVRGQPPDEAQKGHRS